MKAVPASLYTAESGPSSRAGTGWEIPALVAAATIVAIGLSWDISWHQTIGRDTFWTPAHVAIYLGGASGGLICGWIAIRTTYFSSATERMGSVRLWGGLAPYGAWIAIWGAVAMITSAPFDDWWHNAYGLDVKILSPPHVLLFFGILGLRVGTWLLLLRDQNRRGALPSTPWYYCWIGGLVMSGTIGLLLSQIWPNRQHSSGYFILISTVLPFFLAMIGRSSTLRWGATTSAAMSMVLYCSIIWVIEQFPAHPMLGPIYNPVTHMVPPPFPELMILPAVAFDLLRRRVSSDSGWGKELLLALAMAAAFIVIFLPAQWEFAKFYLSPAAHNGFFGGGRNWGYNVPPGPRLTEFWDEDGWDLKSVAISVSAAFASALVGLRLGRWMSRVQR